MIDETKQKNTWIVRSLNGWKVNWRNAWRNWSSMFGAMMYLYWWRSRIKHPYMGILVCMYLFFVLCKKLGRWLCVVFFSTDVLRSAYVDADYPHINLMQYHAPLEVIAKVVLLSYVSRKLTDQESIKFFLKAKTEWRRSVDSASELVIIRKHIRTM